MIFQTEIVSLDSELEKLQTLIKAKRQERERLEAQDTAPQTHWHSWQI